MINIEVIESYIRRMIEMQVKLDNATYTKHCTSFDKESTFRALFDELGELNHELKKVWCWWKETQPEVNKTKVLEELVDCWHFALNLYYHQCRNVVFPESWYVKYSKLTYSELISRILKNKDCEAMLVKMYVLTEQTGFAIEEVYEGYLAKNKINYERLASGY